MYLTYRIKSIPKPARYCTVLYFVILALLELSTDLHSRLRESIITRFITSTTLVLLIAMVAGITVVADIQRKDSIVEDTKDEIIRLYVKHRPEAEQDAQGKQAKWELITHTVNEYIEHTLHDIDENYRKVFKFNVAEVRKIFLEYMDYISNKIVQDYRTVELEELDIINPWDKALLAVRNMYAEDLRLSFGQDVKQLEKYVYK